MRKFQGDCHCWINCGDGCDRWDGTVGKNKQLMKRSMDNSIKRVITYFERWRAREWAYLWVPSGRLDFGKESVAVEGQWMGVEEGVDRAVVAVVASLVVGVGLEEGRRKVVEAAGRTVVVVEEVVTAAVGN